MTTGRRLVALAFLGLAAPLLIQASCVGIVGVDVESYDDVVKEMCGCTKQLGDLGTSADCEITLAARLHGAGEIDRAAWMQSYSDHCTKCPAVPVCLALSPMCVLDECKLDAECCQTPGANLNRCIGGHCASE